MSHYPPQSISGFILNQKPHNPQSGVQYLPATLKSICYECRILNNILKLQITQIFRSSSNMDFSESFYEIQIEQSACLEHFEATFDGKKAVGVIKSIENAQKEFQNEKSQGNLVSYADLQQYSTQEQVLQVSLGNLPLDSDIQIKIAFSYQVSSLLNSFYTLTIPLIQPANSELSKQSQKSILIVNLTCTTPITFCESKGYPVEINKINTNTFEITALPSNSDVPFSLVYGYEGMFQPQVVFGVSKIHIDDPVKQAIMPVRESIFVSFLPAFNEDVNNNKSQIKDKNSQDLHVSPFSNKLKESILQTKNIWSDQYQAQIQEEFIDYMDSSKCEFIFLLDRSGSMEGEPLQKAIEALTLFLKSLPNDSYFNIFSFGTSYSSLFPESIRYSQESLKKAILVISGYQADLFGTEILKPLEEILQMQPQKHYNKQIFLLTDGSVSKPEEVIKLVTISAKSTRIHAIGFGTSADRDLLEQIAKFTKSICKLTSYSDDLQEVVMRMLIECLTPVLDDFKVDYDQSIFESTFPDVQNINCVLKDEIFNFHLFLKPLVQLTDLTDSQRTLKVSYFDSKKKAQVDRLIYLQTTDEFSENWSLRESVFKFGKQLELNEKIKTISMISDRRFNELPEQLKVKEGIITESIDYQILNNFTGLICVVNKIDDARYQLFEDSKNIEENHTETSNQLLSCLSSNLNNRQIKQQESSNPWSQQQYQSLSLNSYEQNKKQDEILDIINCSILNLRYQSQFIDQSSESVCCSKSFQVSSSPKQSLRFYSKIKTSISKFFRRTFSSNKTNKQEEDDSSTQKSSKINTIDSSQLNDSRNRQPINGSKKLFLAEILEKVESDGMWKYDESICLKYISKKQLQALSLQFAGNQDAFMTALILAVLMVYFISDKVKWNLISKKAQQWIKQHSDIKDLQQIQEELLKAVKEKV